MSTTSRANVYPECDECAFKTAYAVETKDGQLVLCAGCIGDLRAAGHYARILRSLPRPRASGIAVWKGPRKVAA
jgi:hypothetical protein